MNDKKSLQKSNNFFRTEHWLFYITFSFIISVIFNMSVAYVSNFCPDFIFQKNDKTFYQYIFDNFFKPDSLPLFYSYWTVLIICYLINIPILAFSIFILYYMANLKFVFNDICRKHTRIITSCNPKIFHDKVALVVGVCNDFSVNALIQTANQTYKNIDIWICDDSNNPKIINEIDSFAKKHSNVYICRRDQEHKKKHASKIGNVTYWLNIYGNKYDYVFENDSSSIVTSTFVENALCYFHSPLLKNTKINCIVCNGNFYNVDKLQSKINSIDWQISNEMLRSVTLIDGNRSVNDGWCAFYKTSTLKQIPLEDVECASCDAARGMWLSKRNYISIVDPFDFGAKMATQNIKYFEQQRIKWAGAEAVMTRKKLLFNKKNNVLWNLRTLTIYVLFIPSFFSFLTISIISIVMKANYWNFSSMLIILLMICLVFFIVPLICFIVNYRKRAFKAMLFFLIFLMLEIVIFYIRVWYYYVIGIIFRKTPKNVGVTKKTVSNKSSFANKIKICLIEFVWILLFISIFCIICLISSLSAKNNINENIFAGFLTLCTLFILWFNIFPMFILPPLLHIIFVFIGEIKIKNGYNPNSKDSFPIQEYDFRYWFIKDTEIWKKQHNKE